VSYIHAEGVRKGMQFDARGEHLLYEQKFINLMFAIPKCLTHV